MTFDEARLQMLKEKCDETIKKGEQTFVFDGQQFFTGYAKYVIEYLENQFKEARDGQRHTA